MRQALTMIARQAGRMMREARAGGVTVTAKEGIGNFVTDCDENVQRFLQRELRALLPEAGFVGEEDHMQDRGGDGLRWIVDPIDGTANFIRGMNYSAVSIGLAEGKQVLAGAVYNPFSDELFYGEQGKGAFLNDAPIHAARRPLKQGFVCMGITNYSRDETERMFSIMRGLFDRCEDLRSNGACSLDICSVAAGRLDAYAELRLCPWDYAAASCVLLEAGGRISEISGNPLPLNQNGSVLAASAACYDEALLCCRQSGASIEKSPE